MHVQRVLVRSCAGLGVIPLACAIAQQWLAVSVQLSTHDVPSKGAVDGHTPAQHSQRSLHDLGICEKINASTSIVLEFTACLLGE